MKDDLKKELLANLIAFCGSKEDIDKLHAYNSKGIYSEKDKAEFFAYSMQLCKSEKDILAMISPLNKLQQASTR